ncbi:DUF983 domain-containing protein [Jiella endophytica]|uniref:DUF983 domain-containing protein n=1 Tax=Jiella endophytica TaxID=2558362 RepID=A0A4Y8R885_9HYPH|nr:DUF983 domain-containing protein [Jiella endophytica]TFF17768.1 DUF983 domain-containing protein [Jiella endophytica]
MVEDSAFHATADSVKAATRGRCPRCGEGKLFAGFLSLKERCSNCDLGYDFADAGDGPAVFVILIIGFVVCGLALWLEVAASPPLWVHFLLWIPLTLILCLPLLRILKGTMIGLQYRNRAAEGRLEVPSDRGE